MLRRLVVAAGTAFVVSIVVASSAAAQTGVLAGTITAGSSKTAVEGATVTIVGTKLSTVTDKDGRFTIAGVPAGDHELNVRRFQFAPVNDRVRVAVGDTTRAYYELLDPREREMMERVQASQSKGTLSLTEPVGTFIKDTSLHKRDEDSPIRVTRALTEEERSRNAPIYIIDGIVLPADFNVKDIDQMMIESVDVIRSAAAIQKYGERAVNGAIIITTNKPRPPQG